MKKNRIGYIKKAMLHGDYLVCLVSSDRQVIMKKGKVNEPERERADILHLILEGLGYPHYILINSWDIGDTHITFALRFIYPDILCRGTDKKIEDMPVDEKQVCDELGIQIVHVKGKVAHGSSFI